MGKPRVLTRCKAWALYEYIFGYGHKLVGYSVNKEMAETFILNSGKAKKTHLYIDDKGQYHSIQSISKVNII